MYICGRVIGLSANLISTGVISLGPDYLTKSPVSCQQIIKPLVKPHTSFGRYINMIKRIDFFIHFESFSTCSGSRILRTMYFEFYDSVAAFQLLQMSHKCPGVHSSSSTEVIKAQPGPKIPSHLYVWSIKFFHYDRIVIRVMRWRSLSSYVHRSGLFIICIMLVYSKMTSQSRHMVALSEQTYRDLVRMGTLEDTFDSVIQRMIEREKIATSGRTLAGSSQIAATAPKRPPIGDRQVNDK